MAKKDLTTVMLKDASGGVGATVQKSNNVKKDLPVTKSSSVSSVQSSYDPTQITPVQPTRTSTKTVQAQPYVEQKKTLPVTSNSAISSLTGTNASIEDKTKQYVDTNKHAGNVIGGVRAGQRKETADTEYMLANLLQSGKDVAAQNTQKRMDYYNSRGVEVEQVTPWETGDKVTDNIINALYDRSNVNRDKASELSQDAYQNWGQYENKGGQLVDEVLINTGNNALRWGKRAVLSALGVPGLNAIGDASMFLSSAGDALRNAKSEGYDDRSAMAYSLLTGAANAGFEHLSDPLNIAGYSWGLDDAMEKQIMASSMRPVMKFITTSIANAAEEGLEEYLTEIATNLAGKYTLGQDVGTFDNAGQAFLMGAASSALLGGLAGQYGSEAYNDYKENLAMYYWRMSEEQKTDVVDALARTYNKDPDMLRRSIEDHALDAVKNMDGETLMRAINETPVTVLNDGTSIYEYIGERTPEQKKALKVASRPGNESYLVESLGEDSEGNPIPSAELPDGTILLSAEADDPLNGVMFHEVVHVLKDPTFISEAKNAMQEKKGEKFDNWFDSLKGAYAPMYADVVADENMTPLERKQYYIEQGNELYNSDPDFRQKMDEEVASYFAQYYLFKDQKSFNRFLNNTGNLLQRSIQSVKDAFANTDTDLSEIENKYTDLVRNYQNNQKGSVLSRMLDPVNIANHKLSPELSYSLKSMGIDMAEGTDSQMVQDLLNTGVFTNTQEADAFVNNVGQLMDLLSQRAFLDMHEEADKDTRAFHPIKKNSDKLYEISLDYSTLCKKRIITQAIIEKLNVERGQALDAKTQFAITELLRQYQAQESKLQVACALCYVEAAHRKLMPSLIT